MTWEKIRTEECLVCGDPLNYRAHLSRVRCHACRAVYEITGAGLSLLSPDPEEVARRREVERLCAEEEARIADEAARESRRAAHRDADWQDEPYEYLLEWRGAGEPRYEPADEQ